MTPICGKDGDLLAFLHVGETASGASKGRATPEEYIFVHWENETGKQAGKAGSSRGKSRPASWGWGTALPSGQGALKAASPHPGASDAAGWGLTGLAVLGTGRSNLGLRDQF